MHGNLVNLVLLQSFADPSLAADPAKDKQFAEKEIDAMRAKKDEVSSYFSLLLFNVPSLVHLNNDPSHDHSLGLRKCSFLVLQAAVVEPNSRIYSETCLLAILKCQLKTRLLWHNDT